MVVIGSDSKSVVVRVWTITRHGGRESTPLNQSPSSYRALKMKKPHFLQRIRTVVHWKRGSI